MQTEPEQWAVVWHKVALIAQDHEDPCLNIALCDLHRAFEERERKMREALRPFANVTILPDGSVVGLERHWFTDARAALGEKS